MSLEIAATFAPAAASVPSGRPDIVLSNQDLILAALSQCGGRVWPGHVEDIAVAAHRMAPTRFVWARYTDQIDLEKIRASIRFLGRDEGGAMVVGSTREGWLLTRRGAMHVRALAAWLPHILPEQEEALCQQERARLEAHSAFVAFREGRGSEVRAEEIESVFRVAGLSPHLSRALLVERLFNIVGDDPKLRQCIDFFSRRF